MLAIIADDFTGALDTGVEFVHAGLDTTPVSYTHLDVYKRQMLGGAWFCNLSPSRYGETYVTKRAC